MLRRVLKLFKPQFASFHQSNTARLSRQAINVSHLNMQDEYQMNEFEEQVLERPPQMSKNNFKVAYQSRATNNQPLQISPQTSLLKTFSKMKYGDRPMINQLIQMNVMELLSNEIANIPELTEEVQDQINKSLVYLIEEYYEKFQKRTTNKASTYNIEFTNNQKQGLIEFLSKIKYLTYHINNQQIGGLSTLILLYSTAQDLLLKSQNFFEIQKAGLATAVFKLLTTEKQIEPVLFTHILFVITRFTINNISGYLQNTLYKFIYQKTPQNWYLDKNVAKSIIYSHGKMTLTSDNFSRNIFKLCERYENGDEIDEALSVKILICCLNLRLITSPELKQRYPKLYRTALKKLGQSNLYLMNMVRNEVWDEEYWKTILSKIRERDFLSKQMRSAIPTVVHHLKILEKYMPEDVRKVIMGEIKRIQSLRIYEKVFSNVQKHHSGFFETEMATSINSFEREVWRSLKRLGYKCGAMERIINCVRVDLYFPRRKLIVELNGEDHYVKSMSAGKSMDLENVITSAKQKILRQNKNNFEKIKIFNNSNFHIVTKQIVDLLDKYPYVI